MSLLIVFLIINIFVVCESEETFQNSHSLNQPNSAGLPGYGFVAPDSVTSSSPNRHAHYQEPSSLNPLHEALLLSKPLGIPTKFTGYNTLQHQPINPYIALLLSHYGRYVAVPGAGRGIYSYGAANNYHNNKPFGSYKIYGENDI